MDEGEGDTRRGLDQEAGLPDARRVVAALNPSLTRAAAAGLAVAIVALDIDDMKVLNDRYGVPVGDRVLAAVASSLVDQARRFDIVARSEGDEFMVVLLDAGAAVATAWAELARAASRSWRYLRWPPGSTPPSVSPSMTASRAGMPSCNGPTTRWSGPDGPAGTRSW